MRLFFYEKDIGGSSLYLKNGFVVYCIKQVKV